MRSDIVMLDMESSSASDAVPECEDQEVISVSDTECADEVVGDNDGELLPATLQLRAHVSELFSPPRMCAHAATVGLRAGSSYDTQTGTDLSTWSGRANAWHSLETEEPHLLVCSPPCTAFSPLQRFNVHRVPAEARRATKKLGEGLLDFAVACCKRQHEKITSSCSSSPTTPVPGCTPLSGRSWHRTACAVWTSTNARPASSALATELPSRRGRGSRPTARRSILASQGSNVRA